MLVSVCREFAQSSPRNVSQACLRTSTGFGSHTGLLTGQHRRESNESALRDEPFITVPRRADSTALTYSLRGLRRGDNSSSLFIHRRTGYSKQRAFFHLIFVGGPSRRLSAMAVEPRPGTERCRRRIGPGFDPGDCPHPGLPRKAARRDHEIRDPTILGECWSPSAHHSELIPSK
jgi:hypothetical protein